MCGKEFYHYIFYPLRGCVLVWSHCCLWEFTPNKNFSVVDIFIGCSRKWPDVLNKKNLSYNLFGRGYFPMQNANSDNSSSLLTQYTMPERILTCILGLCCSRAWRCLATFFVFGQPVYLSSCTSMISTLDFVGSGFLSSLCFFVMIFWGRAGFDCYHSLF